MGVHELVRPGAAGGQQVGVEGKGTKKNPSLTVKTTLSSPRLVATHTLCLCHPACRSINEDMVQLQGEPDDISIDPQAINFSSRRDG